MNNQDNIAKKIALEELVPSARAHAEDAIRDYCVGKTSTRDEVSLFMGEVTATYGWSRTLAGFVVGRMSNNGIKATAPVLDEVARLPEVERYAEITRRIRELSGGPRGDAEAPSNWHYHWNKEASDIRDGMRSLGWSEDADTAGGDVYLSQSTIDARHRSTRIGSCIRSLAHANGAVAIFCLDSDTHPSDTYYSLSFLLLLERHPRFHQMLRLLQMLDVMGMPPPRDAPLEQGMWSKIKTEVLLHAYNSGEPVRPPNDEEIDRMVAVTEFNQQNADMKANRIKKDNNPRYEGLESVMRRRPERGTLI